MKKAFVTFCTLLTVHAFTLGVNCQPSDILILADPVVQSDFFLQLDSVVKQQYPNNDLDTGGTVDMYPALLVDLMNDIDTGSLQNKFYWEDYYHFNRAPAGFTDPEYCKNKVSIEYLEDVCSYRMVLHHTFLVEPNWCTESQVVYFFKIINGQLSEFTRNAAG